MVAFAADAGLIITKKDLEKIRRILEDCYEEVQRWMESLGHELADHKTEAVLFTSRKKVVTITLDVGQCTITSHLDKRLNFKAHVQYAAAKAARVGQCVSETNFKHRWTSSTSKETFSFSGDFDTHIWNSHLE